MGTERKLITCTECHKDFAVPLRRGKYPTRCDSCDPTNQRRRERTRERRTEARLRFGAQVAKLSAEAQQERMAGRERLDPLWQDDGAMIVSKEVIRAGLIAGQTRPAQKLDVAHAVRKLAEAEGQDETYDLALELAGAAIAWAFKLRPDDYDYGELMAA